VADRTAVRKSVDPVVQTDYTGCPSFLQMEMCARKPLEAGTAYLLIPSHSYSGVHENY